MSPAAAFRRLDVRQHSPEWDALHLDGVSSSQIPALMGNRSGLFALWAAQVGQAPLPEPDAATREQWDIGLLLEDDLAELYQRREGFPVRRVNQMLESTSIPWARASLDRVRVGDDGRIVELKTALNRGWRDSADSVPAHVQDQVQWQMLVTGRDVVDVAVLEGGRFRVYEIGRDDGYIEDELVVARWFRELVRTKTPPPLDGSAEGVLRRMHPFDSGEIVKLEGPDSTWDELAARYAAAEAQAKAAEREFKATKAAIRALLGDDAGVESEAGGYLITLRNTRSIDWQAVVREAAAELEPLMLEGLMLEHSRVDWQAIAKTLRVRPKLVDAHATADGPRRFHVRFKIAPAASDEPGDGSETEDLEQ